MSFIERKETAEITPLGRQEMRWHFWFAAAFSAFIVITFVYYLPLRFFHTEGDDHHEIMPHTDEQAMENEMMADGHIVDEHTETIDRHDDAEAHGAHGANVYHEETAIVQGLAVNLNVTPSPALVGIPTKLDFFANEKPNNAPVTDLEIEHEKLIHVIGVRDDLNEFFHIHPNPAPDSPGLFTANYAFKKPGVYKLWSDITRGGTTHSFGHPQFAVGGDGPRSEPEVNLGTNVIVGNYQVKLNYGGKVFANRKTDVIFEIRDVVGTPVAVEQYLGAPMHLAVIKNDLRVYMHTHPEEGHGHGAAEPLISRALANGGEHSHEPTDQISFHVSFPETGVYKLFAQFRPQGIELPSDQSLVAAFYVQVEPPKGILAYSNWWSNLIVSLILIVFLSYIVKRFITVSPNAKKT